jgi:hypothetical protein
MKVLCIFFVLSIILLTACTTTPVESTKVVGTVAEPPTKAVSVTLSSILLDTQTNTPKPTGTATARPTATATPEKFSIEAISFVPRSESEINKSVEIRSPIDDPAGYKEDMEAYLVKVHQILEGYTGDFLTVNGGMGVGSGKILLFDQEINPIASVFFRWEGRSVPILTLPAQDKNGRFGLNIIINPNSDIINNSDRPCVYERDWRTDAMLKSFPSKPISPCSLEVATDNSSRLYKVKEYPFSQSFLKEKSGENAVLSDAVWKWLKENDFTRTAESEAGLVIGYQ